MVRYVSLCTCYCYALQRESLLQPPGEAVCRGYIVKYIVQHSIVVSQDAVERQCLAVLHLSYLSDRSIESKLCDAMGYELMAHTPVTTQMV